MESVETFFSDPYDLIKFDESLGLSDYRHVAHCCIYSPFPYPAVHSLENKAYILMQMRFDGRIGFPGGVIKGNKSVDIVCGLNRELVEETNLDEKYFITKDNHYISCFDKLIKQYCHFFTKEVSVDDFQEIERNALNAEDYGEEVLGSIRVPLVTLKDGIRGFPVFLSNSFAGSAKCQLLDFVVNSKLMSYADVKECLLKSQL